MGGNVRINRYQPDIKGVGWGYSRQRENVQRPESRRGGTLVRRSNWRK